LALAAGLLDEACGGAEAGECVGEVLAGKGVGIVLAHGDWAWGLPAPWSWCGPEFEPMGLRAKCADRATGRSTVKEALGVCGLEGLRLTWRCSLLRWLDSEPMDSGLS
jgi:hypothetical protein